MPSRSGWRGTALGTRSDSDGRLKRRPEAGASGNPVALERLTDDAGVDQVTYRSDKTAGPTAGTATVDPLEFLARVVTPIPNPGQVMQRDYGWYASRTRGARRPQGLAAAGPAEGGTVVEAVGWSARTARARWADLLRRIFEVDPLTCPQCQRAMRVVAVIIAPAVIARILAHRVRARDPTARPRRPLRLRRRPPSPTAAGRPHP